VWQSNRRAAWVYVRSSSAAQVAGVVVRRRGNVNAQILRLALVAAIDAASERVILPIVLVADFLIGLVDAILKQRLIEHFVDQILADSGVCSGPGKLDRCDRYNRQEKHT
jgi:hypothetical protein